MRKIAWSQVFLLAGCVIVPMAVAVFAGQVLPATVPSWLAALAGVASWLLGHYITKTTPDSAVRIMITLVSLGLWYALFLAYIDPTERFVALWARPWLSLAILTILIWVAFSVVNDCWQISEDALTVVDSRMYRPGERFFLSPFVRYETVTISIEQQLTIYAYAPRFWEGEESECRLWPWVIVQVNIDLEKMRNDPPYNFLADRFNERIRSEVAKLFFTKIPSSIKEWVVCAIKAKELEVESIPIRVRAVHICFQA